MKKSSRLFNLKPLHTVCTPALSLVLLISHLIYKLILRTEKSNQNQLIVPVSSISAD